MKIFLRTECLDLFYNFQLWQDGKRKFIFPNWWNCWHRVQSRANARNMEVFLLNLSCCRYSCSFSSFPASRKWEWFIPTESVLLSLQISHTTVQTGTERAPSNPTHFCMFLLYVSKNAIVRSSKMKGWAEENSLILRWGRLFHVWWNDLCKIKFLPDVPNFENTDTDLELIILSSSQGVPLR